MKRILSTAGLILFMLYFVAIVAWHLGRWHERGYTVLDVNGDARPYFGWAIEAKEGASDE
jgi:hypothetical protein